MTIVMMVVNSNQPPFVIPMSKQDRRWHSVCVCLFNYLSIQLFVNTDEIRMVDGAAIPLSLSLSLSLSFGQSSIDVKVLLHKSVSGSICSGSITPSNGDCNRLMKRARERGVIERALHLCK